MEKSRVLCLTVLVSLLAIGCSRNKNKNFEELNREQGRVIADLNQQVAGLQEELARSKSGRAPVAVAASQQKSNYIK